MTQKNDQEKPVETLRLEELWGGGFGDAYVDRNLAAGENRKSFWLETLKKYPAKRVLEVGCNVGGNARWITEMLPQHQIYGIDVNRKALQILHERLPEVNAIYSPARELPFRDRWFDLVFTMGVLIHQPESTLPLVMNEIVRCSRRYVVCGEYYAAETTEVAYRGQSGALLKRDYGRLYTDLFPELSLLEKTFFGREQGWDDITVWIFEKTP